MRTESGLSIHRVDEEQGGFHIELKAPADHDPDGTELAGGIGETAQSPMTFFL